MKKKDRRPDLFPGEAQRPHEDVPGPKGGEDGEKDLSTPRAVPPELGGQLLDGIVRGLYGVTWGKARKLVESGKVFVDGAPQTKGERRVRAGSTVEVRLAAPKPRAATALPREAIVFVDPHLVVVSKPAGVSTVPFEEGDKGTLDELLLEILARPPYARPGQRGRPTLGVVHRLDKETTGLLVFPRTWQAKQGLSSQFRFHTVHRRYFAIVNGYARTSTYETHLLQDRGDGVRGSAERRKGGRRGEEGQRAVTHVEVIERFKEATLVACRLETGRTHQIRIHLSESGTPLVGERVYVRGYQGPELPAPRLMLHAAELGFTHPASDEPMRFDLPLPKDMEQVLARLRSAASAE